MKFTRRRLVQSLGASLMINPLTLYAKSKKPKIKYSPFIHGVASGDPLQDRVILWTRITLNHRTQGLIPVKWSVSSDINFETIVNEGVKQTSSEVDYTVKIDATGLQPATTYYYRFQALGHTSPSGRTKTLPVNHVEHLRIAFTSCASYPHGYFNVYRLIAQRNDLDVVLHLGDYIYEYANGDFGDGTELDRLPQPLTETLSLADYRTRYAQCRADPDLQEAHRQHPFINIWDDHEVANDAWKGGAENHNPELGDGDWFERRAAAIKAYYEWIPIRKVDPDNPLKAYRKFQFGNLLDLMMLDTRLVGRDQQVQSPQDPALNDSERELLGTEQSQWLFNNLDESQNDNIRWRILGQQVMFGQLVLGGELFSVEQWDGYPASRQRVINHIKENNINNTIFLTGDIHSSWAMDITENPFNSELYNPDTGMGSIAVEFVTPSVTSPALDTIEEAEQTAAYLYSTSPHMKYIDLFYHGYVLLDITHERTQAEWYHAESITEKNNSNEVFAAAYKIYDSSNYLVPAERQTSSKPDSAELVPNLTVDLIP